MKKIEPKNKTSELFKLVRSKEDVNDLIPYIREEIVNLIKASDIESTDILFLFDNSGPIGDFTADGLYKSIIEISDKQDSIMLILSSNGGQIEPAYLISKCIRGNYKNFKVAVPRIAKSAATLLSLGAHEIHMGSMSQLGPIDPQVGGLPALALGNALEYLAVLSEKHPQSSEMFAIYLSNKLNLHTLGYFERISESAVQYAERLLSDTTLPDGQSKEKVASALVYSYKDHGFAIDCTEAKKYLGEVIKIDTKEYNLSEKIYNYLFEVDLFTSMIKKKSLSIIGSIDSGIYFFDLKTNKNE